MMNSKANACAALVGLIAMSGCQKEPQGLASANANNVATVAAKVTPSSTSTNEVAPARRPPNGVVFKSVMDLNQHPNPGQPQLRGGMVAVSSEWPASLYAIFNVEGGMAACTAALVGPQAVLTAGHCSPPNGLIQIRFGGQTYPASCSINPGYGTGSDASADYSLCKTNQPVAVPAGFQFETINTAPMDQLAQQRIVLGGYGCISDVAANDQTDGLYRIGYNTIDETSDSQTRKRGDSYYKPKQVNNLLTRDDPTLANLCPGDSGGPAFKANQSPSSPFGSRTIIGVNSRVFYKTPTTYGSSLISATGGPSFRPWAMTWMNGNHVAVCGLGGSLPNCRH